MDRGPAADHDGDPVTRLRVDRAAETLRHKTLAKLRDAILTGYFKPDQRLVERDICEQTGVSRTSVREALRHLESEGLVESRGAKGTFVVNLTADEAMQIYELRIAVETEAARLFAQRASAADLDALAETVARLAATATAAPEAYWKATNQYFDIILRGAGNRIAYDMMQLLRARITYLRAATTRVSPPGYREATVAHMGRIAERLLARDGDGAAREVRSFIGRSAEFAVGCLKAGKI